MNGIRIVGLAALVVAGVSCSPESPPPTTVESHFAALATAQRNGGGLSHRQAAGKRLYNHYCAVCHGDEGHGDGFNAFNLQNSFGVQPADLSKLEQPVNLQKLRQFIAAGGAAMGKSRYMPPWGGTLAPAQIRDIAIYVARLATAPDTTAE